MEAAVLAIIGVVALAMYWRGRKSEDKIVAGEDPPMFPDESSYDDAPGGKEPDATDPKQVILQKEQAEMVSAAVDNTRTPPGPSPQIDPAAISPVVEDMVTSKNTTAALRNEDPVQGRSVSLLTVLTDQFQVSVDDEDGAERPKRLADIPWDPISVLTTDSADQAPPTDVPPPGSVPTA